VLRGAGTLACTLLLTMAAAAPAWAAPGDLDPTLGGDGLLTFDPSGGQDELGNALAVQPDGRMVLALDSRLPGQSDRDIVVLRLLPDGSPDESFSSDGRVVSVQPGDDVVRGLGLDPASGEIVVFATGGGTNRLLRLTADGATDTGFGGGDGFVELPGAFSQVDTRPGGGTVLAGSSGPDAAVTVLDAAGAPDASFGTGGTAFVDLGGSDAFADAEAAPDGSVVAVGRRDFGTPVAARLTATGDPDPGFGGGDGQVTLPDQGPLGTDLRALDLRADGSVVTAGRRAGPGGFDDTYVARLTPDGTPDPAFGGDGVAVVDTDARPDFAQAVAAAPDGGVFAAVRRFEGSDNDLVVLRLGPDGELDRTFDGDGRRRVDTVDGPDFEEPGGLALMPDGRPVVSGWTGADGAQDDIYLLRLQVEPDLCPGVDGDQRADLDGDGTGDACDPDQDGDGLPDASERAIGSDPRAVDSDGDGLRDGEDACPTRAGAGGCPATTVVTPPGPPPPVTGLRDVRAPRIGLARLPSRPRLRTLRRGGLAITVVLDEPAALEASLVGRLRGGARLARAGDVVLAERSLARAPALRRSVRLRLGRVARRALRRGARLELRVVATDAEGNRARVSRRLRVG
jgi:uncharacterized delta-60 repeat protein